MMNLQELDGQLDSILNGSLLVKFLLNNITQTNDRAIIAWLPTVLEWMYQDMQRIIEEYCVKDAD